LENKTINTILTVYRTSSDYYQTKFISFFNKLINFESWQVSQEGRIRFGENWANILLDKWEYLQNDSKDFDFYKNIIKDSNSKYNERILIDKIVAVTLSSHLLAEEIRDLYSSRLGLLRNEEPQLIKLTNFYEFYNEETFNQIEKGDNVLIVNDVISTGNLNDKLYKSLTEEGKNANVIAIFSLVDTRMDEEEYNKTDDNELRVENFYETTKRKLVCILHHYIPKYKSTDQIPKEIINGRKIEVVRINPVLNAPTPTIKKSDQIVRKLIYNDNSDKDGHRFLKNIFEPEDSKKSLCVGHIENFGSHHPYFIDTKILFQSETGKNLIGSLIVDVKNLDNEIIKKRNKTHLTKIRERFERLKTENTKLDDEDREKIDSLLSEIIKLKESVDLKENYDKFDVDFVVHASDSGFDYIKRSEFSTFLQKGGNKNDFQIVRMPRVLISQEWGIPNIPDSYKHVFAGRRILILDSASCTGETLLNLIDSMCYLDVKKITVLSVITRIKDFHGEFLTRIHKINNNKSEFRESSIPIDIYFGVHLNLPHYLANSTQCPHCKEIHDYKEILYKTNPPKSVEDGINYSREFLKIVKVNDTNSIAKNGVLAPYLLEGLDLCRMFQIRDELGKKEHQRTYNKYFKSDLLTDSLLEDIDESTFDEFVGVLLHEPHLIDVIRKEHKDLYYALKIIVDFNTLRFIPSKPQNKKFRIKLKLPWDRTSLLFVYSFFFEDEFFIDGKRNLHSDILVDKKFLKRLLEYSEEFIDAKDAVNPSQGYKDEECLNYVSYLIWIRQVHKKIDQKNISQLEEKSEKLFVIIDELRKNGKKYFKLQTRRLLNKLTFHLSLNRAINKDLSLGEASFLLYKIFTNIETEGKNHGNLFVMVSNLQKALKDCNLRNILSLWKDDVKIKFQEILIICETLRPAFEVFKQISHYRILFNDTSSLTSFVHDLDDLVEQIENGEERSDLFISKKAEQLHIEIRKLLNHFFEHKAPFFEFASSYSVDIVQLWKFRHNPLIALGFRIQNENGKDNNNDPDELKINMHEILANYVIFNQLEVNVKSYGKANSTILYKWTKEGDFTTLTIKNQKEHPDRISEEDIKSTFNGLDNWKRLLPRYGIETTHSGLLSEDKWFETKFKFSNNYINYDANE